MGKVTAKFGDLSIGARFWEAPDGDDYAFQFPMIKVAPTRKGSDVCNAQSGEVWFYFEDTEDVLIEREEG